MKNKTYLLPKFILLCIPLLLSLQLYSQTSTPPSKGDGTLNNPYEINSLENLYWLSTNPNEWSKHFIQTADIDASSTKNSKTEFTPIGDKTVPFTGTYRGNGHIIDQLNINLPSNFSVGLFGRVENPNALIDKLGLTNIHIIGNRNVGSMVGYLRAGTIKNCFASGNVQAISIVDWSQCGGFVGYNNEGGTIKNCYANVDVDAKNHNNNGGFVGPNRGVIEHCFSTGKVIGTTFTGGFSGQTFSTTRTIGCFWDKENSGRASSYSGTGLTNAQMKDINNFLKAGWDFVNETKNGTNDIWKQENNAYPSLKWHNSNISSSLWEKNSNNIFTTNNVAINSTSVPDGYNLAVNGKIIAHEIKVSADSWPDYVFTTKHKLLTLSEINDYIVKEGHLPNMPSKKEIVNNGFSLGEMDAKLLEKIEELTLLLINQSKEVERLKKQNEELMTQMNKLKN